MAGMMTERESAYLQHLKRAKSLGISLSEYCRRSDLRVGEWYQVRRHMVQRGLMGRTRPSGRQLVSGSPTLAFAPVRVTSMAPVSSTSPCLIRHPSGWTIECAGLPPANWLRALATEDR